MDKQVKDMWNFITRAQYQLNKNFMFHAEVRFFGSRSQIITDNQYRFGL